MLGKLSKLTIEAYKDPEYNNRKSGENKYSAQVNPEYYTINHGIEVNQPQEQGSSATQISYNKTLPQELEFEFLFDSSGVLGPSGSMPALVTPFGDSPQDVVEAVTKFKNVVYEYDGETHEPPYLKLYWGTLLLKCRMTKLSILYKLFKPDGTPIRAIAKCTFLGVVEDNLRIALENRSSPDLTHQRTVKRGDTLPLMCKNIYKNPALYLEVAKANGMSNFRKLEEGMIIYFPPLEKNA